jgi:hypothetical protein
MLKLNHNVMVIRRGALRRSLSHEYGALMNGIVALPEEVQGSCISLLPHEDIAEAPSGKQKAAFTQHQIC